MYSKIKRCSWGISCCSFLLALALFPTLLLAAPKDKGLSADFYRQIDHFLKSSQSNSKPLVQEAHQIVQQLGNITDNQVIFLKRVKELKAYLRLVCDFSKLKALQRTLLLENEINTHVESLNQEIRHKRAVTTWIALAIGTIVGIVGVILGTAKESDPDAHRFKIRLKKIGTNILIWAPITIGGALSLAHLITAKEVEERQVLLIHPAELIEAHSGDLTLYEIESYLQTFLTSKKEPSRSQVQEKLHVLYSKAPKQLEARIRYMQEVLEYAPQKLDPPKKEQQKRLQALQKNLSLQQSLSSSLWEELRYFLSNHMYGFAVVGALLGIVVFLLSLYFSGEWSWLAFALSVLIGLNVGLSVGYMAGDLIKKESAHEILHYEVLF